MKKFFLCSLGCMGIAMAFYAGVWTVICDRTGLLSWAGFAGCTSYFACGKKKLPGVRLAAVTNLSGIIWAMFSIILTALWDIPEGAAIWCAVISFMIIIQSKMKELEFIPGAYIGCFVTFAVSGNWQAVIPAMAGGILLGCITDVTGEWLHQKIGI